MGEFLAVYMVDPVEIGDRFTLWPLHITLVPWFNAPDLQSVEAAFRASLKGMQPLEVKVGERAHLGMHKWPVRLVQNTSQLQALHDTILQTVNERGWRLDGRYTGPHFKPHVTQKNGRDASGTLRIDTVYIAESQPQGYRQIVGKVDL